jgi:hypothetical protein
VAGLAGSLIATHQSQLPSSFILSFVGLCKTSSHVASMTSLAKEASEDGSSATKLWTAVMEGCIQADEASKPLWRVSGAQSKHTCGVCELEGVLLQCEDADCQTKYHLSCANHEFKVGLFLTRTGRLSLQCKDHFKVPLFCQCLTPYNDKYDYTQCDACWEWYHNECQGIQVRPSYYYAVDG